MRSTPESRPEASAGLRADTAPKGGSWIPLLAAVMLVPFANGGHSVAMAAWLAPFFLLRFTRSQRALPGLALTLVVQVAALATQFRGMVPFPPAIYASVMIAYGIGLTLPYVGDRILCRRLPGFPGTLVFPFLWTGIEFLTSLGPFGSWFSVAYSQYGDLPLLQILSVTGLWGVTFLIGWAASAGNALWEEWPVSRRVPRAAVACFALLIAVVIAGGARLALFSPSAKTVRIASLSRLELALHPDPEVVGRFFRHAPLAPAEIATIRENAATIDEDLLRRSEREALAGARIVFWGEANAPVLKNDEDDLIRRGGILARSHGIYLGMALAAWHLDTTPPLENKIVLVRPDGHPAWEFFKANPVPGSEAAISIRRDGRLRVLDTPYGRLSSIICFDADFPRLLAQAGRLGADIVLDPSNDWKAIDPLHTRMASFRAVEQGFNMVRHTSRGLSAAFDYQGRLLASMDHYVTGDQVLVARVPIRGVHTLYAVLGDWLAWTCLAGLIILGAMARRLRARREPGSST